MKPTTTIKDIAEIFWQFHNDRLDDPSIKEMKPYIQPILDMIDSKVKEAGAVEMRSMLAYVNFMCDQTSLSRYFDKRINELERTP